MMDVPETTKTPHVATATAVNQAQSRLGAQTMLRGFGNHFATEAVTDRKSHLDLTASAGLPVQD